MPCSARLAPLLVLVLAGCAPSGSEESLPPPAPPAYAAVEVAIMAPTPGATLTNPVAFEGEASQDGVPLPEASLLWESSLDGALGSGRSFILSDLSPGPHTITLRAETATSTATAAVDVRVTRVIENASTRVLAPDREKTGPDLAVSRLSIRTATPAAARFEIGEVEAPAATGDGLEHAGLLTTLRAEEEPHGFRFAADYDDGSSETADLPFVALNDSMFSYAGDIVPRRAEFGDVTAAIDETHGAIFGLEVVLLPGRQLEAALAKESLFTLAESTAEELYASVRSAQDGLAELLATEWNMLTPSEREAAFLLNAVAFLWHHGNFERTTAVGCVQMNELITEEEADSVYRVYPDGPIYWKVAHGMGDFLRSPIGCCADRAFLLQVLLEQAGFRARRIAMPDHSLNEAEVDGRWYTLDATAGVLVDRSLEEMLARPERRAYVFFSPYLDPASPLYSPVIAPWFPRIPLGIGLPGSAIQPQTQLQPVEYNARELEQIAGR